jgi:GPH family glycoside/pentoside/hexuronide:cation symporter
VTTPSSGLSSGLVLRYGLLALPLAFSGLPIYIHAPDFYATQLAVPLAAIGLVLLALRIIDAVQDPLIGSISDRFHAYRRWVMVLGLTMLAGGFVMVFHPLTTAPLLWLALSIFICTTGFSIVSINYQALGGLWDVSSTARTRVASWREGLGLIGLLAASITPTLLMQHFAPRAGFALLSLAYLPLLLIISLIFFGWWRRATIMAPASDSVPLGFADLLRDPWVRRFFALYLLSASASAIPAVLVLFFIRDYLGAEPLTGVFLLLYFLSGVAAMPLWTRVARIHGKLAAWRYSIFLATATFVWAFFLAPGDSIAYGVICVLSGMAFGADLALPPAILADRIAAAGHQHAASRYYAGLTFSTKAALALATGLALPVLAMVGYQPGMTNTTLALPVMYALLPCVMKATAGLLLWRFHTHLNQGVIDEKNLSADAGGRDGA